VTSQAWEYSTNWCTQSANDPTSVVCANPWWDQWHSGLWRLNTSVLAHGSSGGASASSPWDWWNKDTNAYRWGDAPGTGGRVAAYATNENPYPEVSGASGVWVTVDGGNTWSQQNNGLRMRRVSALRFTPDGKRLIAGLNGGGFYVADVSGL
jgi:hypothetical protein